jgi:hypothetical protein
MDAYDGQCLGVQNGNECSRLVVDPTSTVPANISDCLEVDNGSIRLNQRAFHIDYTLKGTPGMDVTKMSCAEAVIAAARRANLQSAFRQNGKRICSLQLSTHRIRQWS